MARVDAEAALDELAAWIAVEKSGYGRQELLERIAVLRQRHRVSEDFLDRVSRLYGGPVALLRHLAQFTQTTEDESAAAGEDELDGDKASDLGQSTTGGHDGRHALAGAGRD